MGSRSLWKGPYVHPSLFRHPPIVVSEPKVVRGKGRLDGSAKIRGSFGASPKRSTTVTTWSRGSTVLPVWVGAHLRVHNGKRFQLLKLSSDRVGHKLGEFVLTRKRAVHLKKLKVARKR